MKEFPKATEPDWGSLPPLREVIARHDLRAEKKLGQNFLLDRNITDKIARAAGDLSGATVFEIGPGPGGLTRSLLKAGARKVIAVEFDQRAVAALRELETFAQGRLEVLHADALQTALCALAPATDRIIVANLPYNIATPLLTGWLEEIRKNPQAFKTLVLMFQKEVAQRLAAQPGSRAYGRLSVITQWLCNVETVFHLPPQAFTPPPKVASSIARLIPVPLPQDAPAFEAVEKITAGAFGQRRKMLRTSLAGYAPFFESCGIDPSLRAEDLPVSAYIALAKIVS